MADLDSYFQELERKDPTWASAHQIVTTRLAIPNHVWRLFRTGWGSVPDPYEFFRLMGFCKANPASLMNAAELSGNGPGLVQQALQVLGIRYATVVLAINYVCKAVLRFKPPPTWRKLLAEMMSDIEIGYRFGSKVADLGLEGGALMGFAHYAGLALLLAHDPKGFKELQAIPKEKHAERKKRELEIFGCEAYQVSALALQQLGFGTEAAYGVACLAISESSELKRLDKKFLRWRAALDWIECLREGRNYPAHAETRTFFHEVNSPKGGTGTSLQLQVIYTEVAKIRSSGSKWVWHLPKPSYEETSAALGI